MRKVFCFNVVCIITIILLDTFTNHYSINMDHEMVLEKFNVLILLLSNFQNEDFSAHYFLLGTIQINSLKNHLRIQRIAAILESANLQSYWGGRQGGVGGVGEGETRGIASHWLKS